MKRFTQFLIEGIGSEPKKAVITNSLGSVKSSTKPIIDTVIDALPQIFEVSSNFQSKEPQEVREEHKEHLDTLMKRYNIDSGRYHGSVSIDDFQTLGTGKDTQKLKHVIHYVKADRDPQQSPFGMQGSFTYKGGTQTTFSVDPKTGTIHSLVALFDDKNPNMLSTIAHETGHVLQNHSKTVTLRTAEEKQKANDPFTQYLHSGHELQARVLGALPQMFNIVKRGHGNNLHEHFKKSLNEWDAKVGSKIQSDEHRNNQRTKFIEQLKNDAKNKVISTLNKNKVASDVRLERKDLSPELARRNRILRRKQTQNFYKMFSHINDHIVEKAMNTALGKNN